MREAFSAELLQYIVDKKSAKLGSSRETHRGLDRNHSDICKFSRPEDPVYLAVGPKLRNMAENARSHYARCDHGKSTAPN